MAWAQVTRVHQGPRMQTGTAVMGSGSRRNPYKSPKNLGIGPSLRKLCRRREGRPLRSRQGSHPRTGWPGHATPKEAATRPSGVDGARQGLIHRRTRDRRRRSRRLLARGTTKAPHWQRLQYKRLSRVPIGGVLHAAGIQPTSRTQLTVS